MILRVTFLRQTYVGGRTDLEWPPHPARLYAALVAAYHDRQGTDAERNFLLALQGVAPEITAPDGFARSTVTTFVPVNALGKVSSLRGRHKCGYDAKTKHEHAAHITGNVFYHFDISARHKAAAESLAARVPWLGNSKSCCVIDVVDKAPAPNLVPTTAGENSLRVPHDNYYGDLQRAHQANQQTLASKGIRMARPRRRLVAYGTPEQRDAVNGEFSEMLSLRLRGRQHDYIHGPTIARMVRSALLAVLAEPIPASLSGHDTDGAPLADSHVAYVPLPFAGHRHADGHIMGIGLLLPQHFSMRDRLQLCQGLSKLKHVGQFDVEQFDESWSLRADRFEKTSNTFTTVFPIEVNYPRRNRSVLRMVEIACEQAQLPAPAKVEYSRHSLLNGTRQASALRCQRGYLTHARITFPVPVRGPISIGRGRYLGFGLCLPTKGTA